MLVFFRQLAAAAAAPEGDEAAAGFRLNADAGETLADRIFLARMRSLAQEADAEYAGTRYREALRCSWFALISARDEYVHLCSGDMRNFRNCRLDLLLQYAELQAALMAPITPHWSEYVHREIFGHKGSIFAAGIPASMLETAPDLAVLRTAAYVETTMKTLRTRRALHMRPKKGAKAPIAVPTAASVEWTLVLPDWQVAVLNALAAEFDAESKAFPNATPVDIGRKLMAEAGFPKAVAKKIMPFVAQISKLASSEGASALETSLPFHEGEVLAEVSDLIKRELEVAELSFVQGGEETQAAPGKPVVSFA
eukprot:gnl/Ergobibamus_cyprinoides/400.p1 GENE.gnl/Ergobibamus_cyprinoides/400~~gnl/Ergobibamus_cyprinoides/400.p1  ORF type:complete len:353 (+),score=134.09 gnl/Ergobibamus_cyprinoides/400:132-1061(+)